jgi:type II secretory pathway component PulJ
VATDLIGSIREKQQRIVALRREILALEGELREAKAILNQKPKHETSKITLRKRPIRPQSSVWWAQRVLQHAGKPIHIDELLRRVEELSGHTTRKSTLVSNLSRYVRMGDTFVRIEEGTYALADHVQKLQV